MSTKEEIKQELRKLTKKENILLTKRGNRAIKLALKAAKSLGKTTILIQDQGGWITYNQFPEELNLELKKLPTNHGILDKETLQKTTDEHSCLLINSLPGYFTTQSMEEITKTARNTNTLIINDVSGSIGTNEATYGDIVVGSFGRWKPINAQKGGFIAFNENREGSLTNISTQTSEQEEGALSEEELKTILKKIKNLPNRLAFLHKKVEEIKEQLKKESHTILEENKKGLNVVATYNAEEEKQKLIDFCKKNNLEFTECPRYIRVLTNAISIEVKRLEE